MYDFRERIKINGQMVSEDEFARHFWHVYDSLCKLETGNVLLLHPINQSRLLLLLYFSHIVSLLNGTKN